MAQSRGSLLEQLDRQLSWLVSNVELAVRNNRTNAAHAAETTLAGLLNRIHGWALVNANSLRQNYPGIDLIDRKAKIGVQVTATHTTQKIRHTLEEAAKLDVTIDRLIIAIITNKTITAKMKVCAASGFTGTVEIWNIPDILRTAEGLDVDRLADITGYLDKELGSMDKRLKGPWLELPLSSTLQSNGFVGRREELKEIRRRFAARDKLVVLTGLGGMGKSELAMYYGREHPGEVYFVRFDKSFSRTLANMAQSIRPPLSEEELRLEEGILCEKVLKLLRESDRKDLLIIDNVDNDNCTLAELQKDAAYAAICALPLGLLLTTRSYAARAIPVEAMAEKTLYQIFHNHGAALSETQMEALITAVNSHTLTVDLIARTLNGKQWQRVTAEDMLAALREHKLPTRKYREVAADYIQSNRQAQIYEHLSVVFDMSGMSGVSKKVMRCASLLPEVGMDAVLFGKSLNEEEQRALDVLLERGWLEVKEDLLTIHPLIRLVSLTELASAELDCGAFLERLWEQYDQTKYIPARYSQMAELFVMAHDHLGCPDGRWLNRSGMLWSVLELYPRLYDLYKSRLPALERILPANAPELAEAYRCYGIVLGEMGRYDAALEYGHKALDICLTVFTDDAPELARSYNSMGILYGSLGEHQKALEHKQKALEIRKRTLPPEHPKLASSYNNVGISYGNLGDDQKALDYKRKALEIQKKVLPSEHPRLASSYNNVGLTYSKLGNHQKALEYERKALAIRIKALPPEHPDLASSYNNVGMTYGQLGRHRKELVYELKALEIREKVLPPEHPDLAISYKNIAGTLHRMRDIPDAAKFMRRAADIISRSSLPEDHPYRVNYPTLAELYELEIERQRKYQARPKKQRPRQPPSGSSGIHGQSNRRRSRWFE